MKHWSSRAIFSRVTEHLDHVTKVLLGRPVIQHIDPADDPSLPAIGRIYVINLDRQTARWSAMRNELCSLRNASGVPLLDSVTRVSACDAQDGSWRPPSTNVVVHYSLADQLYVDPRPEAMIGGVDLGQSIEMSRQEVAVAMSHIAAWRMIAAGEHEYALILEDDIYFARSFGKVLHGAFADLRSCRDESPLFDMLYLAYTEVRAGARKADISDRVFRVFAGLWELSGYVMSRRGAAALLERLPVCGPVDLWVNHQFDDLDVFGVVKPAIKQRVGPVSDNRYSAMPILSKFGLVEDGGYAIFRAKAPVGPVFAFGEQASGLTSLAMALSILGYRCCSDLSDLPDREQKRLLEGSSKRAFDAYVNIGSLDGLYGKLAQIYPQARFIVTSDRGVSVTGGESSLSFGLDASCPQRLLRMAGLKRQEWKTICEFLECLPPRSPYPAIAEKGRRPYRSELARAVLGGDRRVKRLKFDKLPWILRRREFWVKGQILESYFGDGRTRVARTLDRLEESIWELRGDTFPGNLAMFAPENCVAEDNGSVTLTTRNGRSGSRKYSSAAISSREQFIYGSFEAEIRPARVPGIVSGMFLHRNSPRQEIDVELLGKNPRRLLINVYYNPGVDGSEVEYGYRGTPVLIDLGFDASADFHRYRIDWEPTEIRWSVDGQVVYERRMWCPTPIPHLPMQFHLNAWPSRSVGLAGRVPDHQLPAGTQVRAARVDAFVADMHW